MLTHTCPVAPKIKQHLTTHAKGHGTDSTLLQESSAPPKMLKSSTTETPQQYLAGDLRSRTITARRLQYPVQQSKSYKQSGYGWWRTTARGENMATTIAHCKTNPRCVEHNNVIPAILRPFSDNVQICLPRAMVDLVANVMSVAGVDGKLARKEDDPAWVCRRVLRRCKKSQSKT